MNEIWIVEIEELGDAAGYEIRSGENGVSLADEDNLEDALQTARSIAEANNINHVKIANAIDTQS